MNDTIKAFLFGRNIANKLIKQNPGKHVILFHLGIGDCCLSLSYAKAYKQKLGIEHLAVVTYNPAHGVLKYFKDAFDSLIQIKEDEYNSLLKFLKSDLGYIYRKKHKEIECVFPTAFVRSELFIRNPYISMTDVQKMIYGLPMETLPCTIQEIPCREWLDELIKAKVILPKKTILLNPYAKTVKGVPATFFEKVADVLISKGFTVITSIHGNQKEIKGTKGLNFSLEKTLALANECGYVIGLRSGFMDLCAFSDAKIVSIDSDSYLFTNAYKLEKMWKHNKKICSYVYVDYQTQEIVNRIADYMCDALEK